MMVHSTAAAVSGPSGAVSERKDSLITASILETMKRQFAPSNSSREKTPEKFETSFGTEMTPICNGKKRWELSGAAQAMWKNVVFPLVKELMQENQTEVFKTNDPLEAIILRCCYMLGIDEEHAHPTVVIACDGEGFKGIIRNTMRLILNDNEFKTYGFKVIGIRAVDLKPYAGPDQTTSEAEPGTIPSGPISLCGRQVSSLQGQFTASTGGTVLINGKHYAVTAAHPFVDGCRMSTEDENEQSSVEIFTSEWALSLEDDSSSDEKFHEEQRTLASSNMSFDQGSAHSTELGMKVLINIDKSISEFNMHHLNVTDHNCFTSGNDWALIDLQEPKYFGANEIQVRNDIKRKASEDFVYLDAFDDAEPHGPIIIPSQGRIIQGKSAGSQCDIKFKMSREFSPMWSFALDSGETAGPGDSGSWVVNAETNKIHGTVVAGSRQSHELFVASVSQILENIRNKMKVSNIELPRMSDSLWLSVHFNNAPLAERLLKTQRVSPTDNLAVELPGLSVEDSKNQNVTMLHWAANRGHSDVAEVLVSFGADVNAKNTNLETPLHWATFSDGTASATIVDMLLNDSMTHKNATDRNNRTALWWAADRESVQAVKRMILHLDINVNRKDRNGRTALHQVARNGNIEIANLLIQRQGIEFDSKDHDGVSVLQTAEANGNTDLVMLLRESEIILGECTSASYDQQNLETEIAGQTHGGGKTDAKRRTQDDSSEPMARRTATAMSPNTYSTGEWVWHAQFQNYYIQTWDGVQWTTTWANQSRTPRHDSATVQPETEAGQELASDSVREDAILGKPEHGNYEYLDPSYFIQPHPRRFFTEGRMFSILFTEPLGLTPTNKEIDNVSTVMYGEQVYVAIRRFIVVKEGRGGFCYACPISTYGGRGTTRPGLDPSEHAIVYSTNLEPRLVPGEMQLQMNPIPVDPFEGSGTLAPASRINFAIYQPIQHNVKAKNLGMVHMTHIPTLIQYARAGLGW